MMRKCIKFLVISLFFISQIDAQERPKGRFLTDSIEVGRPFRFALSFRHTPEKEVFFPDTTFRFTPFEALDYEYFDTKTNSQGSLDSAVYTLVSFDLSPIQKISIPVWIQNGRDCTAVYSAPQSIRLKERIKNNGADSLKLKSDTAILPLQQQVNFPKILLVLSIITLLAFGVYLVFWKQIERQWQLYQLYRRKQEFIKNFTRLEREIDKKNRTEDIENAVVLWKKYLARLEHKPFTTFTSKEITDNLPNEELEETLKEMDGMIYGGGVSPEVSKLLKVLENTATESYQRNRVAILNAAIVKNS